MIDAHDISRSSKLKNGISREIQMAISFHSNVRFTCIIYRDRRNWIRKLSANSNGHNFWLECMIEADYISRHWRLNNGSSREIQMAITFHLGVRFTCIIYQDTENWTTEALEKFKWLELFTRMSDSRASYIETHEIEHESSRQIQTAITFDNNVWSTSMIYRDSENWTTEAHEKFKWL